MAPRHMMLHDIVEDHRERIKNIKKFYPYFRLIDSTFAQYKEGKFQWLDMGYFTLAVLRFFIEENNFREKQVTYPEYEAFMKELLHRDYDLFLEAYEEADLITYIFEKLKNDGRPFTFDFYDPVDKKTKTLRTRLLESTIKDGVLYYSLSADAIEFYLDTKEIKEESRVSVEQLLLEKLIQSQNFRGAVEVVRRINNEVSKMQSRKDEVLRIITYDIYEGLRAHEVFTGQCVKWFDQEQKLFLKNSSLIQKAMEKASREREHEDGHSRFYNAMNELYTLESELTRAIQKHSELLSACTQLSLKVDEVVEQAKFSALRTTFDFRKSMQALMQRDRTDLIEHMINPLLVMNIKKTFSLSLLDDLLSYRGEKEEAGEQLKEEPEEAYVYEDDLADQRIGRNFKVILRVLFHLLASKPQVTLKEFHDQLIGLTGSDICKNGDYFSFLVHLCQKKEYILEEVQNHTDTFLEASMKELLEEEKTYQSLRFRLIMEPEDEPLKISDSFEVTSFVIETY